MIQRFNTRARVLKRTSDLIHPSNIIFNSMHMQGRAPSLSLNIARLPSVLDPIVMECSEFHAFFWAFSQSPTIPPTEDRGLWLRDCPEALGVGKEPGYEVVLEYLTEVLVIVPCHAINSRRKYLIGPSYKNDELDRFFLVTV